MKADLFRALDIASAVVRTLSESLPEHGFEGEGAHVNTETLRGSTVKRLLSDVIASGATSPALFQPRGELTLRSGLAAR